MSHSRRRCMRTEPPQDTIPPGKAHQYRLDTAFRGEQWFTVAITVETAPSTGNVTFGDCINLHGNPALVYPIPGRGYLTVDDSELPLKIVPATGDPNNQITVVFFGEPVEGVLGITNTTDRAVTVQIQHADRFFQED